MSRISSSLDDLKPHYDVVVVGSGYGGAISASRLARAGRSVCILERGREIRPGEYPDALHELIGEAQVQLPFGPGGSTRLGSRTGLFDVTIDKDINVLVGCGLGGTSLINANVSLRPDPRVFACAEFPRAVVDDLAFLDVCYTRAEQMLKPTPYPDNAPPLKKTEAQALSAEALESKFWRLPINVNFEDHVNHVGVHQPACTRCGDCVSGCNVGAKNTVLMNYLPDAHNHGAEIFCEASVDHIERHGDRWLVHFEPVGAGRKAFNADLLTVTADVVVLGAGTLGTVGILLRSKEKGLAVSNTLGQRFTGNGDMLGFAYDTHPEILGVGWGDLRKGDDVGPCITSAVDNRDTPNLTDGYIIQEGAIPGGLRGLLGPALRAAAGLTGEASDVEAADKPSLWNRLFGGADDAATKRTQTYLVMAHDDGAGQLYLTEDGRTRIRWPGVGKQGVFDHVHQALRTASNAIRGTFVPNPVWTTLFDKQLITVHPLGGAHMGEDATSGVADDRGRVFSEATGTAVHPGLYVSDGAFLPRPLGVNPLLTISAFAERNAHYLAEERGWTIDYTLPRAGFQGPGGVDVPVEAVAEPARAPIAVRFTETMKGFISGTELDSYEIAAFEGEKRDERFEFILTIGGPLVDMVDRPDHPARMVGTVEAALLSDRPLLVTEGHFNLFITDADDPTTKRMWYRMRMQAVDGKHYYFEGFKEVHDDPGFDLWSDTSTLYVTVWAGDDASGPKVARGILHILKTDFLRQLTTMQVLNSKGRIESAKALAQFGRAFAGELWDIFGIG